MAGRSPRRTSTLSVVMPRETRYSRASAASFPQQHRVEQDTGLRVRAVQGLAVSRAAVSALAPQADAGLLGQALHGLGEGQVLTFSGNLITLRLAAPWRRRPLGLADVEARRLPGETGRGR
jgi:hypothetical protein